MTNEDQLKTSQGSWVKVFRKNLQGQEGKELFRKTEKVLIKIHLLHCKLPYKFISWALK